MLLDLVFLGGGFILLAKGADWLVGGSSKIARMWGVAPLVVGLTVVAWGTSAPEVVVSVLAAAEGKAGLTMGNVLGSNIANIGLVLGTCSLFLPEVLERAPKFRESFWLVASVLLLWVVIRDLSVDRVDGALLLGAFLLYNLNLYLTSRGGEKVEVENLPGSRHPWRDVLIGTLGVAAGAKLVVMGAEDIAREFGVTERVIGLTVIALGTSLPELAAGLDAVWRKEAGVSIGNVVGSNVFNVLAVVGLAALISPFGARRGLPAETLEQAAGADTLLVLAFSFAAILLPLAGGKRFGRLKGLVFLLAYVAYNWRLFLIN